MRLLSSRYPHLLNWRLKCNKNVKASSAKGGASLSSTRKTFDASYLNVDGLDYCI